MFFKDVEFFMFLLILPIIGSLFFYALCRRQAVLNQFFFLKKFKNSSYFSKTQKILTWIGHGLVLIFMIVALARPFLTDSKIVEKGEGLEIIIALDVSQSMQAQDVLPSRLFLMKSELSRFLSQSNRRDRVGLIVFAGSSFLISPLTFDIRILQTYLDSISPSLLTNQGSNFKSAFELAQRSFESGGLFNSQKVFILASDGEDHEVGALEAARNLHEQGVRIFTLGVGTQKGGPILTDSGYLRNSQGDFVVSQFKERALKKFAQIGEGVFYHLFANSPFIDQLHDDLDSLEKNIFEEDIQQGRVEVFQFFLMISILLIFWKWVRRYEIF